MNVDPDAIPTDSDRAPKAGPAAPARTEPVKATAATSPLTRSISVASIIAAIALVLLTGASLWLLGHTTRIITWFLVSGFFAVVLTPPVDWIVRNMRLRRSIAVTLVFVLGLAALGGLGYTFVKPLAKQATQFANDFPTYVKDAESGRGTVGKYVKRYKLDDWLTRNQDEIRRRANKIFAPEKVFGTAVGALGSVFSIFAAILTMAVLTFLMLMEGRELLLTTTRLLRSRTRDRVIHVARDAARAITGYVNGNLLISVIAGLATFVYLLIVNVPFAGVLALWVAFADLIPLVGATLGAIPPVILAFLSSTTTGVATVIFYIVYQQFENQVLQVTIMARAVALKPLVVLGTVLFGVELFGLLGALLAIPVAGIIKVIGTDIVAHRRPDLVAVEHVHGPRRRLSWRSRG